MKFSTNLEPSFHLQLLKPKAAIARWLHVDKRHKSYLLILIHYKENSHLLYIIQLPVSIKKSISWTMLCWAYKRIKYMYTFLFVVILITIVLDLYIIYIWIYIYLCIYIHCIDLITLTKHFFLCLFHSWKDLSYFLILSYILHPI